MEDTNASYDGRPENQLSEKVGELLSLLNIVTQTKAERDEDAVVQAV